jgi:hypothetical protein
VNIVSPPSSAETALHVSLNNSGGAIGDYQGIRISNRINDYGVEIRSINTGASPSYLAPRLALCVQDTSTSTFANITEKLSILGSGAVGIGTTIPSYKLHTYTSDEIIARFQSTDDRAVIMISDDDTDTYIGASNATTWIGPLTTLSTWNLNIDAIGQVGIGSTNPGYRLDVSGSAKF